MIDQRAEMWQRRFEWPILVAALLVIPAIVVEESSLGEPWNALGAILNWGIWLVFLTELLVMLYIVPKQRTWLAHHAFDVLIVVFTPPFLPAALQSLRALRLLRVLRILRALPAARTLFSPEGVRNVALVAAIIVIGGGAIYASVETDRHLTTWDGVWWAITTVTTVGYGDISPTTDAGRAIAIVVMLTGIGFVAFVTAAIAERFVNRRVHEALEEELGETEADLMRELRDIRGRLEGVQRRLRSLASRAGSPTD